MKAIAGVWGPDLLKRFQNYEAGPIRGLIWKGKANENNWNKEKLKWVFEMIEIFILC